MLSSSNIAKIKNLHAIYLNADKITLFLIVTNHQEKYQKISITIKLVLRFHFFYLSSVYFRICKTVVESMNHVSLKRLEIENYSKECFILFLPFHEENYVN